MKINKITKLLNAHKHFIPDDKEIDINYGTASDMMSDVLAYNPGGKGILLITGLLSPQVIRTAELMDISAVVFTRGKKPPENIIDSAKKDNIAILSTDLTTYITCGILYSAGLQCVDTNAFHGDDHES